MDLLKLSIYTSTIRYGPILLQSAVEAEKKRRWQRAVKVFAKGDPNPPDDHVETIAMWDTLVRYHEVFLEAKQEGVI